MFTKNFKNLMVLNLLNATSNDTDLDIDKTVRPTYYDIEGTELNMYNGVWNCGAFASALSDTLQTSSGTQNSSWLIIVYLIKTQLVRVLVHHRQQPVI